MDSSPSAPPIYFYSPKDPYYEFSNFYTDTRNPILIDGVPYATVEQYFQSQKFNIPGNSRALEYSAIIQGADSPLKVKCLGSQKKLSRFGTAWVVNKKNDQRNLYEIIDHYADVSMRPDWEEVKTGVMKKGLLAKFAQSPALASLLKNTGHATIIENSPKDSYWGIGKDGTGRNMLGKLLMEVRVALPSL